MSDPKRPAKPFLGEEELSSALDAWDEMFDNLIGEPDGAGARIGTESPAARTTASLAGATTVAAERTPMPTEAEASHAVNDLDDEQMTLDRDLGELGELGEPDEQMTLDRDLDAPVAADSYGAIAADAASANETDFSEIGASSELPAFDLDDDGIYTSASRPTGPAPGGAPLPDDPIAPPPRPAAPARRTGPAIIRRATPVAVPVPVQSAPKVTPRAGYQFDADPDVDFGGSTRIADYGEIEAKAEESRRVDPRSKAPTAAPPMSFQPYDPGDDDDDYEIEIGSSDDDGNVAEPEPAAPRRTAAHVVRRNPSRRAAAPVRRESEPIIEISHDEPPVPAGEEDFSDVAAAVGDEQAAPPPAPEEDFGDLTGGAQDSFSGIADSLGAGDIPMDALPMPPERVTPVGMRAHGAPMQLADEPSMSGDAYVPITPQLADDLEVPFEDGHDDFIDEAPMPHVADDFSDRALRTSPGIGPSERPPALMDLYPRVKRPTSVPVIGVDRSLAADSPRARGAARDDAPPPSYGEGLPELEPAIDLDALGVDSQWPEQLSPLASSVLDEDAAHLLAIIERELPVVDDPAAAAELRIEAGRLCERLGEAERARTHYDAALLADPRATPALRGLRRIARAQGDLVEATRQLDAEIAVAGALERRPLSHYRVDLLLASGEYDLARVAVGELLDSAPSDVRALLAQLELAFLDGRADEFGRALEQLAHAVRDNELRAAVQQARGTLAAHQGAVAGATGWFAAAAESDVGSLVARLSAIRDAAGRQHHDETAQALLELARQVEQADPATAAALAMRAQHWTTSPHAMSGAELAARALPADPLVARVSAETALDAGDVNAAVPALAVWADCAAPPAERAYAAARAAELDPVQGSRLWAQALQHDPGDDYAAAQLRTAYVASEQMDLSMKVDLEISSDPERARARLRAAFGLIAQGDVDAAIDLLREGHAAQPAAVALAEALAEALAASNRWGDRARALAELAREPGDALDRDVAQLRSALAWEEAVGAAASSATPDADEIQRATAAALAAWGTVIEQASGVAPEAHAAAIVLATRLGDRDVLGEVLARAQAAERSPWGASSIALRRARLLASDATAADALLAEAPPLDDPRRVVVQMIAAARRDDVGDIVTTLEERAAILGDAPEAYALRLRAAQLALDTGDAMRATTLLRQVEQGLPSIPIVSELLAAARRRAGDASGPVRVPREGQGPASPDEFARVIRDADDAAQRGDGPTAIGLYQAALEMRPGDPLAAVPLVRVAMQQREPAPIAALALAQLRAAETSDDGPAKAHAYELMAHVDRELRADADSAQVALERASQADPSRIDLMHRLERDYAASDQIADLLRLRRAELEQIPTELAHDRAAMSMDTAMLAAREGRPDAELAELYRQVVAAEPRHRQGLMHLEAIVRRAGASEELARLEDQIAAYFEGDARTQASFLTRAGETLVELGQIDAAVQKFGAAEQVAPGHVPALESWRNAAMKGQLWLDVAEAATRQASAASDPDERAALHHFAGVALMDKALIGEQAMLAFRRALDIEPGHRDAFVRMRILLEEEGSHDELAILIANRLEHEPAGPHKVALHRALAELSRNFLGDRETAKKHYREILQVDSNDLRAHAAIADIAWEQGEWQEAADALISRARLEQDAQTLKTLCFRLGLIYADRLVDVPMALKAFQRALTYDPDDEQTLVRLADLATQASEWKLALAACERLVKAEQDPDKRAVHLQRVARVFKLGFGDNKRAERALNLALDGAPTNEEALAELVKFYRDAGDMVSVRVHLNRVAGTMRVRAANDPKDGVAYRVISRAMTARAAVGVDGSIAIARAAAELAQLLGAADEAERLLLGEPTRIDLAPLLRSEADDLLFPRGVQTELRQIFALLGDRVAKHVGVDLRAYGVTRGDRLRARESTVASHAQDVAAALGFGEIDVYVSAKQPYAMLAEPTSPVSLVIGQAISQLDSKAVRFAAGYALKLAHSHMAIPARLPAEELGVLVVALLRQFQDKFPAAGLDEAAIAAQGQKLKRLIPTGLAGEIRPFAFAVDAGGFSHVGLARDLRIAGLRAGMLASGSLVAGLGVLAAQAATDVQSSLADPVAQGLITFALGEDHATVTR